MDGKHVILIILMMKQTWTTVYYSKTTMNYTDSVSFCENVGGDLLRYGRVFVTGVYDCENRTDPVDIWTGFPYYSQLGCTTNIGDTRSVEIDKIHLAICADFCEADKYSHMGITDKRCTCYLTEPKIDCDKNFQCKGNPRDICGQNDESVVYEKVFNTSCILRSYSKIPGNGVASVIGKESCRFYSNNFFCKVGNDDNITCDISMITTTVPDKFTMSPQEPQSSATTKGLIIGVVVTLAVLLTITIIIICRKVRTRSYKSSVTKQGKVVEYQNKPSQQSDGHDMFEDPRGNQQSLMNDSASSRNNTASNNDTDKTYSSTTNDVYDSAAQSQDKIQKNKSNNLEHEYGCVTKSDSLYDSARQNKSETNQLTRKDDLHIYDYRGTTEGLYDSASNQQMIKKPHTEENEYGCNVKPEGLYDVSGTQSKVTSSLPADDIYDHNSDILYDIINKSGSVVTDIYDHT